MPEQRRDRMGPCGAQAGFAHEALTPSQGMSVHSPSDPNISLSLNLPEREWEGGEQHEHNTRLFVDIVQ